MILKEKSFYAYVSIFIYIAVTIKDDALMFSSLYIVKAYQLQVTFFGIDFVTSIDLLHRIEFLIKTTICLVLRCEKTELKAHQKEKV